MKALNLHNEGFFAALIYMNVADLNFGDLLDGIAAVIPERIAIVCGDKQWNWHEFDSRANRLARQLLAGGLTTGSKVAFYLRNSPAYLELFSACSKARLTHVNVNYRYVDHELAYLFDNSDAEAIVYGEEFASHIAHLKPNLDKVKLFIQVGNGNIQNGALRFETLCAEGDASPLGIKRSGSDLYFMYTGGTTGYPKGVMWQHKDRIAVIGMSESTDALSHAQAVKDNPDIPVSLPACPLMHSTGFTTAVTTLMRGGTLVLLPSANFDARECLQQIDANHVQRLAIVGDAFSVPILNYLREQGHAHRLTSVGLISSAGAMWSEPCKRELLEYFPNALLADSLGSSEGSNLGASIMKKGDQVKTARFQIGPLVKVFTEDFREVEPGSGEAGMIAKAGPLPLGYYKDEERTAKTFPTVNGVRYSLAGDWCQVELDGTMTLLGRGNNCINSGGEKIYPEEVEEILKELPEIEDVAILGMPDPRWGQKVCALVRTSDNCEISSEVISEKISGKLASYKHPRHYVLATETFRHDNGKINYRLARQMLEAVLSE